jgi:hypothetical protein
MSRRGSADAGTGEMELNVTAEMGTSFDEDLREFLDADGTEVDADPLFRERLRRRLWAMLLRQMDDDESGSQGPAD